MTIATFLKFICIILLFKIVTTEDRSLTYYFEVVNFNERKPKFYFFINVISCFSCIPILPNQKQRQRANSKRQPLALLKTNVIIIFQTLSTTALSTVRYVEFVCDCCAGAVIILVSSINEKFDNKYFKNYHVCIQSIDLLMCIFIKLCLIILIIS